MLLSQSALEPGNQSRYKKILKGVFSIIIEGQIFHNEPKRQKGKGESQTGLESA